jgi:hypothetical protein
MKFTSGPLRTDLKPSFQDITDLPLPTIDGPILAFISTAEFLTPLVGAFRKTRSTAMLA